jgi:hypothetical protein
MRIIVDVVIDESVRIMFSTVFCGALDLKFSTDFKVPTSNDI